MTQDPTKVYSSRSTAASLSETESDFSVQSNKNLSDNFLKHSPKGPPETGRPATQNQPHSEPRSSSAHKKEMEGKAKTYHFHPKYNFRSFHLFKTRKSSPSILNRSESGSSQTDSEGSMYSENDPWKKSGWGVLDLFESGSAQTKKKSYPELSSSQAAESKKDAKSFRSPFRRRSCTLDSIHRSFSVDEIQAQLNRTEKSDASIPARRSVSLEDDLPLISVAKAPVSGMSRAIQPEAGTIQRSHSQGSPASGKSAELTRNDSSVSLDTLSIYSDYSTRSDPAAPVSIGEKEPKRSQSLNAKYEKHVDKSPSQVTSPRLDLATESKKKIFTSKVFAASKHLRQGVRPVFNEGRFYVVDEILTTELNYLENLEIILNTFMIPIQKSAKSSHPIIPPRDTKIIFEGIESLYDLSQEICQELKDMVEHWDKETRVGVLFLRRQKAWEIYPRFVDNYSFAREAIRRAEATHSFYSFTKHVARKTTKRQTLKELLIIPIQRVTRYTLLLKDLRKQTKPDHPDFRNVEKALEFMTSLAVRVNEVKQREEERTQLFTMYNAVRNCPPTMINANRRFTLETGVLETRTNRKLHLVLYSDYLMLTTPSKGRPLKPTEKWIFVRLIDLRHIIMFNVPDSQDGVNMTVIFVSNPSSPSNEHQSGLSPKTAGELTINTQVGSRGDSPPSPSSPRSHSPLAQSSGDGEVARKAKKPPSETTNKYVFQHPDKKSKVDFLIALENELSSLKKSDIHTPPRTNFIHALKPIHTHPHTHTHTHTHSHHTGSK